MYLFTLRWLPSWCFKCCFSLKVFPHPMWSHLNTLSGSYIVFSIKLSFTWVISASPNYKIEWYTEGSRSTANMHKLTGWSIRLHWLSFLGHLLLTSPELCRRPSIFKIIWTDKNNYLILFQQNFWYSSYYTYYCLSSPLPVLPRPHLSLNYDIDLHHNR